MHSQSRRYKDAIYEQFGRIGKALSSPIRLELLDVLCQGPRTVEVLANEVGHSIANTSHHLQALRRARLLTRENRGVYVTYRPATEDVCDFFQSLRNLAESQLAEIGQVTRHFHDERGAMEPVDREELIHRIVEEVVTVLDVRPREEYAAGHIPGAVSVPLSELERRLAELPRDREIVAYCRGPYCVMALDAVEVLRANGFNAVRFDEGVPEWRARGRSVAAEEPGVE